MSNRVLFSYVTVTSFNIFENDICRKSEIIDNFDLNLTNSANFRSLEVVNRGSETQIQASENVNALAQSH